MNEAFDRVRALNVEGYVHGGAALAGMTGAGASSSSGSSSRDLRVDMNDQMVIVVGALCKMFVGDLVHGGMCAVAVVSMSIDDDWNPVVGGVCGHRVPDTIDPPTPTIPIQLINPQRGR